MIGINIIAQDMRNKIIGWGILSSLLPILFGFISLGDFNNFSIGFLTGIGVDLFIFLIYLGIYLIIKDETTSSSN